MIEQDQLDVLVVDDDADTRSVVRRVLEREGVKVTAVGNGADALAAATRSTFDLVVLDLDLPDMTGLEVLERLRVVDPLIVVVMLTGAGAERERILGLVSGADDYVVKPFSARELAARVMAQGRRVGLRHVAVLEHGSLWVDTESREVMRDGVEIELTPRELELLVHLMRNPHTTFSRDQLLHAVWGSSSEWQDSATVTEHIRRLRLKIERDPTEPELLLTVRGSGYRFESGRSGGTATAAFLPGEVDAARVVVLAGAIVFGSHAALRLVGATSSTQLVGHDISEFIAPSSVDAMHIRRATVSLGGWPRPERFDVRRVDGSEIGVELASSPVSWEGEPASQVMMWVQCEPSRAD
jgi:PAS domain S-box-containing protein